MPGAIRLPKGDIETVVRELCRFLETALDGDGAVQSTIVETR
jgi:hypothetical protein